ncbi:MAG: hypothetical protein H6922_01320 [Pseudomonadaceae bacterium]|nr:hypothetical protein [Pseudomonadaceae bacterium]
MPAYTILIMKRNETDRRPLTLHISTQLFWSMVVLAVALPVGGFLVSAGVIAPAWLKLDFNSMKHRVEEAEKMRKDYLEFKVEYDAMKNQLDTERKARAEAEAKTTMAETARAEATGKLTQVEGELLTLKQSIATYEQLLKPKLERELVQCVNLDAKYADGKASYSLNLTKVAKGIKLPPKLTARVSLVVGDNAVAMRSNTQAGGNSKSFALDTAKSMDIKGEMAIDAADDATRLIDVKVFDAAAKTVGYCWKTF